MKDASELLASDGSLPEGVVILEELAEADSVFFNLGLNLEQEVGRFLFSCEYSLLPNVLIFLRLVHLLHFFLKGLEGSAIKDELEVLDLVVISSVDGFDSLHLLVSHDEAEVVKSLSELLRRHLKVFVAVPVLEEALRVESVSREPVPEGCQHALDNVSLILGGVVAAVEGLSADVIEASVKMLLEVLLGEYFINAVTEIFPADMTAFFGRAEVLKQGLELLA